VWDLIERTLDWLNVHCSSGGTPGQEEEEEGEGEAMAASHLPSWQPFVSVVSRINRLTNIGKDEKVTYHNDCVHRHLLC